MGRLRMDGAALVLFGVGLGSFGGFAVWNEAAPYFFNAAPIQKRLATLVADAQPLGLSSTTQSDYLRECQALIGSFAEAYLPATDKQSLRANCFAAAQSATAQSPANSYAWAMQAYFAGLAGDAMARNQALVQSQRTGPNEMWLAEQRITFAETSFENLDAPALAAYDADLRTIAMGNVGVRSIAQRYVDNPDFRERITAIVETLPPVNQARFLANIRRIIDAGSAGS